MFDLEITNADIVSSTASCRGCVSIVDGKIAAISGFSLRQAKQTIDEAGWTPFQGTEVVGKAYMTFVRGRLVAENGKIVAEPGSGRPVSR